MFAIQYPDGLTSDTFLKQYWQKKPLYLPQAWPDFSNPLPAEELAGLSLDEGIPSRIIQSHGANKWSVRQGPFTEADFSQLDGETWSLLITDVEKHLPEFRAYLEPFSFIPNWRFDDLMISYAPPGGSVGPHVDDYDVFLLQAQGQRHWRIESEFRELPMPAETLVKDCDLRLINEFQTADEFLCRPGDMLYLPPRLGHHGVAVESVSTPGSENTQADCMTWSFGFKAPNFHDALLDYLDDFEAANEHKRYVDPELQLAQHRGEITPQQLAEMKRWFVSQIEEDDEIFTRWLGRFLSRNTQNDDFSDVGLDEDSDAVEIWEPNPFAQFNFMTLNGQSYLYVDGEEYPLSLSLAKQLTALNMGKLTVSSAQDRLVVNALVEQGHLMARNS